MNRYFAKTPPTDRTFAIILLALVGVFTAQNQLMSMWVTSTVETIDEITMREKHWDLDRRNVALSGYDPVTYFESEKPARGNKSITTEHQGVTYRFANEANRETFLKDPAKFEPAYGGWCAYAVVKGGKTSPDPKRYKIVDGRLLLFYDAWGTDTLDLWNRWIEEGAEEAELMATADAKWDAILAGK
ncbi:MAG: YHS domain-containing (seleno)protein [Opitutales bacterium]